MITEFTPLSSLFGGALIGLAAVLLMLTLGKIMGVTGILAGAIMPATFKDWTWRIAVLAGMITAPLLFTLLVGSGPALVVSDSPVLIITSGLLVGIGVTLGSGCTSGHGVCGLARMSGRSTVAVIVFMMGTAGTVFVIRHLLGE